MVNPGLEGSSFSFFPLYFCIFSKVSAISMVNFYNWGGDFIQKLIKVIGNQLFLAFHKVNCQVVQPQDSHQVSEDRVLGPYILLSPSSATLLSGMWQNSLNGLYLILKIWCPKLSSILQVRKLTRPGNRTIVEEASLPWPQLKKVSGHFCLHSQLITLGIQALPSPVLGPGMAGLL